MAGASQRRGTKKTTRGQRRLEVLLDGEGPEGDEAGEADPVEGHGEVLLEEKGVEGPESGPALGGEGGDEAETDDVGGEDALGAAEEKVTQEGAEAHAGCVAKEDARDEIAGEDEEEVDAGPEEVHGPGMVGEDHEQGDGA